MIKYIVGNLLESDCDIIIHGCNCVGGFGSGVASQIAKKWPKAKTKYLEYHNTIGWKLGDIQIVKLKKGKYLANCATQKEYFPRNKVHADYKAIATVMRSLKYMSSDGKLSIGMPKIGCGLAGGDWKIVENIINRVFDKITVYVYTLE